MRQLALAALILAATPAGAHGLWGHIHVTGWAIENLPAGPLRDFFADPDLRNAAWFGATYTDAGYAVTDQHESVARNIAETTHWEPFIERAIDWLRENDPPPWTDAESRRRVAFIMGAACHGLQDEIFDSVFLYKVTERDGGGQDETDPGTDGFMVMDQLLRLFPKEYIPRDMLRPLYLDVTPEAYDDAVDRAIGLTTGAYINEVLGPAVALENGKIYESKIPWARAHYMDPEVPGGHQTEIWPTAAYLDAIWRRLHGTLGADTVVWTYPEPQRRLPSVAAGSPDSWVTLIFGLGVDIDTIEASWVNAATGEAVPFTLTNTRWGETMTRLVRLEPTEDLALGTWYRVTLLAGTRIDGLPVEPWSFEFETPCASSQECPALGPVVAGVGGQGAAGTPWDPPGGTAEPLTAEADTPETAPDSGSIAQMPESAAVEPANGGCGAGPGAGLDAAAALAVISLLAGLRRW